MRLGVGSTVLENCFASGHMDGIGVYTNNLWSEFSTLLESQHAVSFGNTKLDSSEAQKNLGSIEHLPVSYNYQSVLSLFTGTNFIGSHKLDNQIDLFFAPDHHIPRFKNIPVVATIMDAIPLAHPKFVSQHLRRFKNSAFKKTVHWADHIVTISEYSKKDIIKYFAIEEEKISVVPLGVNDKFFDRVPEIEKQKVLEKYNLKLNFFVFVGTLQPRKNILRLIEAFELLPLEIQSTNPLVIIGKYGWGEEKLLKKLQKTDLNINIHWLQNVNDNELYALLQSAIGMVYPSLYEGFGLPLLEGFASKIPVITSNCTSLPEVGKDAVLYVDPFDSKDISKKMATLVFDKTLREEFVIKGSVRVKQFTWEVSAKKHIEVFKKVLKN